MASLSISSLALFFSGEQKSIDRGENHYKSDHVESFNYSSGVIRGEVHASMKNKSYKVTVYLDAEMRIKTTECECPRGEFKCSHAAALYIYGIHNLSRTDIECQWRCKKSVETVQAASDMFPLHAKKKEYNPLSRDPNAEDRLWLYNELRGYGKFTGVCWLLSPEPKPAAKLPVKTIEEIVYSEEFLSKSTSDGQLEFLIENAKVQPDSIMLISRLTVDQRDSPAWHHVRKGRLTASNFGHVLNAKRVTPSLLKRLLGDYDLSGVRAIAWGGDNEEMAVNAFTRVTGLQVTKTGLWLHQSGVLGASPDGLVGNTAVFEAKCPFKHRENTIAEACQDKEFYLENNKGQFSLKCTHAYWHQVQGQMYLTGRKHCYFTVWTTKDVAVIMIKRNEEWRPNIQILTDFFFYKLFPKIVEGEL